MRRNPRDLILEYLKGHSGEWCDATTLSKYANVSKRSLAQIIKSEMTEILVDNSKNRRTGKDTCYKMEVTQ